MHGVIYPVHLESIDGICVYVKLYDKHGVERSISCHPPVREVRAGDHLPRDG